MGSYEDLKCVILMKKKMSFTVFSVRFRLRIRMMSVNIKICLKIIEIEIQIKEVGETREAAGRPLHKRPIARQDDISLH
jgi:hypothetical protein